MGENIFKLTVLGSRGSVPVSGKEFDIYGGATSCYMVEIGRRVIILDAGTGIVSAPCFKDKEEVDVLLSHPHLDHIFGLCFFPELLVKDRKITLYGKNLDGRSIEDQIEKAFSKPYWPLTISEYPCDFAYKDLELPLILEDSAEDKKQIVIEGIEVEHPGGCLAFSIKYEGKKLVYMTDCDLGEGISSELIEFTRDADLFLCDAQFTKEEYLEKEGFGHSTPEMVEELKNKAGAGKTILIHHDPNHTDKDMERLEKEVKNADISYAKCGMCIDLFEI